MTRTPEQAWQGYFAHRDAERERWLVPMIKTVIAVSEWAAIAAESGYHPDHPSAFLVLALHNIHVIAAEALVRWEALSDMDKAIAESVERDRENAERHNEAEWRP